MARGDLVCPLRTLGQLRNSPIVLGTKRCFVANCRCWQHCYHVWVSILHSSPCSPY